MKDSHGSREGTTCLRYVTPIVFGTRNLAECAYIATSSSAVSAQLSAKFVTSSSGGSRGLSEGILYLMYKFFPNLFDQYCVQCHLDTLQRDLLIHALGKPK